MVMVLLGNTNLRSILAIATFSSFMAKFCPMQFLKE